jgi:hypothetical protein
LSEQEDKWQKSSSESKYLRQNKTGYKELHVGENIQKINPKTNVNKTPAFSSGEEDGLVTIRTIHTVGSGTAQNNFLTNLRKK